MKRNKLGQISVEYLTTYGWVLLVVVFGIGLLTYFGFLNPTKYISDNCWFGEQLLCEDFSIDQLGSNQADVRFRARNNFPRDIIVVNISSLDAKYSFSACLYPLDIGLGKREELGCTVDGAFIKGNKANIPMKITYRRNNSIFAPLHFIEGEVFTTVS